VHAHTGELAHLNRKQVSIIVGALFPLPSRPFIDSTDLRNQIGTGNTKSE